ncbi:MAG: Gfo/Idh/MocA family oxidoreductase [Nitrospinae bacterium]|nr:Gfo/Idh/MocA family oxidoreductase [Nitrospinota bacterium]
MTEEKKKTRAGVIGVGRMGQFHANVYSEMSEVELVGVSDANHARGRAVAEKYKIKFFPDYREMLKQVDVASVAVPTKLHFEVARVALGAGVHLLVEKPVSDNFENAKELFDIATQKGLVLHVGHVERFNGAVQELHKIVENPILIQCSRMGPFDPRVGEDSVVLDLMIHDLDIVLNLVNSEVESLGVVASSPMSKVEDVVNVQVKFKSGCLATFTASRATQNKLRNMSISCKERYVYLNFADQEIHVHRLASSAHEVSRQQLRYKEELTTEKIFVHRDNPLKLELRHLVNCVQGAERMVSVENELKSLRLALDILELCRKKKS